MTPPTLQVVTSVLCRQQDADSLQGLGPSISSFIGPKSNLSLMGACKLGSIKLLDWIWYSSSTSVDDRTSGWSLTNFLRSDEFYYQFQFAEAVEVASQRGDLRMVKWLFSHFSRCAVPKEAVTVAASNGHLTVLKFLHQHEVGREDVAAPSSKKRKVVGKSGDISSQTAVETSGRSRGEYHLINWGSQPSRNIELAIYNGHTEVTRWFYGNFQHEITAGEMGGIIQSALGGGDIEFAELIVPEGRSVLDYAAHCARPEIVERRLECQQLRGDDTAGSILRELARSGHLKLLERVAQLYSASTSHGFGRLNYWYAAILAGCSRGDVSMARWLLEHPRGQDIAKNKLPHLICVAAKEGCVEVMQYLYHRGVKDLCLCAVSYVAFHGQLSALKWLVEHFPDAVRLSASRMIKEAANRGHLAILQYLHGLGGFWEPESPQLVDIAVKNGHLAVVKWMHEFHPHTCSPDVIDEAAAAGHLEVIKWLYKNSVTRCTPKGMDEAAGNGHLETMKWLYCYGNGVCTNKAIQNAVNEGHLDVASWLRAHFPHFNPREGGTELRNGDRFEMLLFLVVQYPYLLTHTFTRELRSALEAGYEQTSANYIINWLKIAGARYAST